MSQPPPLSGLPRGSIQPQPPPLHAAVAQTNATPGTTAVTTSSSSSSSSHSSSASSLRSAAGEIFTVRNSLIISGGVLAAYSAYALYRWWTAATPGRPSSSSSSSRSSAASSSASSTRTPAPSSPSRPPRRSLPPALTVNPAQAAAALREESKQDLLTSRAQLPGHRNDAQLPSVQPEEREQPAEQPPPDLMSIADQSPAIMEALKQESQQDLTGEFPRPFRPAAPTAPVTTTFSPLPPPVPPQLATSTPPAELTAAISATPLSQPDVAPLASAETSSLLSEADLPSVSSAAPAASPVSTPAVASVILDTRLDPIVPAEVAPIPASPRTPIAPVTEPPPPSLPSSPTASLTVSAASSDGMLASAPAAPSLLPSLSTSSQPDSCTAHEAPLSPATSSVSELQPDLAPAVSEASSPPAEEPTEAAVRLPPAPSIAVSASAPFFLPEPSPAAAVAASTPTSSSSPTPPPLTVPVSPSAPEQGEQLVHSSLLGVELLAVAVLLVAVFAAAMDARWLLPLAPVVAYVLFMCTQAVMKQPAASVLFPTTLLTAADRLTATTSSASAFSPVAAASPSSSSFSSARPLRPVRLPAPTARSVQKQRPLPAGTVTRSSSSISTLSASYLAASQATVASVPETASLAVAPVSASSVQQPATAVHVSAFIPSASDSLPVSGGMDGAELGEQQLEDEKQPSAPYLHDLSGGEKAAAARGLRGTDIAVQDNGKEERKEHVDIAAAGPSSLSSVAEADTVPAAVSSLRPSAVSVVSGSGAVASSDTEIDGFAPQQQEQLSSPSADERERSFFSPEPAVAMSGASSIALTVKFTYRHPWEEVVQAFWDVTQPDWERNGHTLGLAASRLATPPSASSSSSPRSAGGAAAAAASTDGIEHKVVEYWRSASTGCVFVRRDLHLGLKIPAVVKRCVGPVKRVIVEERAQLDAANRVCRLQTTNPSLHKFLLIHETRTSAGMDTALRPVSSIAVLSSPRPICCVACVCAQLLSAFRAVGVVRAVLPLPCCAAACLRSAEGDDAQVAESDVEAAAAGDGAEDGATAGAAQRAGRRRRASASGDTEVAHAAGGYAGRRTARPDHERDGRWQRRQQRRERLPRSIPAELTTGSSALT